MRLAAMSMRSGDPWSDAATLIQDGPRREVFFFESGGERLYGSLYLAADISCPVGFVICSSWGIEAHRMGTLTAKLARKAAERGGAALLFHYPGYGDSTGEPEGLTMDKLAEAAVHATAAASRRAPGLRWCLVGVRLGASVATLARRPACAPRLLLIQPVLDPRGYFVEILAKRRRAALGRDGASNFAFGYPVPGTILEMGQAGASAVYRELREFDGDQAVAVRYETPAISQSALEHCEQITVPGTWRFGLKRYPELKEGAIRALGRVIAAERPH